MKTKILNTLENIAVTVMIVTVVTPALYAIGRVTFETLTKLF